MWVLEHFIVTQLLCNILKTINENSPFLGLLSYPLLCPCLRCVGYFCMGFVANFICFPAVPKFWKSVKIWQSCWEFKGGNFFWDTVYILHWSISRAPVGISYSLVLTQWRNGLSDKYFETVLMLKLNNLISIIGDWLSLLFKWCAISTENDSQS